MKKWITNQDGFDNLQEVQDSVPQPGDKEVLVKISAVSLNYRDTEGKGHIVSTKLRNAKVLSI